MSEAAAKFWLEHTLGRLPVSGASPRVFLTWRATRVDIVSVMRTRIKRYGASGLLGLIALLLAGAVIGGLRLYIGSDNPAAGARM